MANTTNLNLVKPAGTDHALVSVINSNMDIIDSKVGAVPSNASVQGQIDTLNNQMAISNFTSYSPTFAQNTEAYGDQWYRKTGHIVMLRIGVKMTNVTTAGYGGRITIPHNLPSNVKPNTDMPIVGLDGGTGIATGYLGASNITLYPASTGTTYMDATIMYAVT